MRIIDFRQKRMGGRQSGVAIVEFTIILPFMLFLILAVAEFGRAFMYYNTLTRAVRDSARYVASNALKGQSQIVEIDADLIQEAKNLVDYGNGAGMGTASILAGSGGTVTVTDEGDGVISVLASYPYSPMLGSVLPDFVGVGSISAAFTMRTKVTMKAI